MAVKLIGIILCIKGSRLYLIIHYPPGMKKNKKSEISIRGYGTNN